MSPPYLIRVAAKADSVATINTRWSARFGEELIWTKARIEEHIQAARSGAIESLAHLREQIRSIEDWNRVLPECAENHGTILIADHESTITPLNLLQLHAQVLFLERYKILFEDIVGIEEAYDLMGGRGSTCGIAANNSPIPSAPQSAIYRHCVLHHRLDLWLDFHAFRESPTMTTWNSLKIHTVPWEKDSCVEQLTDFRSSSWSIRHGTVPSQLDVRRALTPKDKLAEEQDELPEISAGTADRADRQDTVIEFPLSSSQKP